MNSIDIIRELVSGRIDREQCNIVKFETSEIGQLADWFGKWFTWRGRFSAGTYFYAFHDTESFLFEELWTLQGYSLENPEEVVSLFKID